MTVSSELAAPARISKRALVAPLAFAALVALYLVLRLPALLSLPLFHDEGVYIVRASRFPDLIQSTLHEGKLLHEALLAPLLSLPGDPLVISRACSALCGLATLLLLIACGQAIGYPSAGWLAGLLYATAPLAILHERLGLGDSLLTAIASGVLLVSIRFATVERPTRKQAVLLGALIGVAALVKLPGLFLIVVPLVLVMGMAPSSGRLSRLALLRVTLIGALLCVAPLAPFNYGGIERSKTEFASLADRLGLLWHNLSDGCAWIALYLSAPLALLIALALALPQMPAHARHVVRTLTAAGLLFVGAFLALGTTIYPRYFLPAWPLLLLAGATSAVVLWEVCQMWRWLARACCFMAVGGALGWGLFFGLMLMRDPAAAPLAAADRSQYLETWTAGYSIPAMLDTLRHEGRAQGHITLANYNRLRVAHTAPLIYLGHDPTITIAMVDFADADVGAQLARLAAERPTYITVDDDELAGLQPLAAGLEGIAALQNPLSGRHIYVLRVAPGAQEQP